MLSFPIIKTVLGCGYQALFEYFKLIFPAFINIFGQVRLPCEDSALRNLWPL